MRASCWKIARQVRPGDAHKVEARFIRLLRQFACCDHAVEQLRARYPDHDVVEIRIWNVTLVSCIETSAILSICRKVFSCRIDDRDRPLDGAGKR